MLATVTRRVNSRLEKNTFSEKLLPLEIGESINVNSIEFGENYRGNNIWLIDNKENRYWSGAFNVSSFSNEISKSTQFRDFAVADLWKYTSGENAKVGIIDCGVIKSHKSIQDSKIKVLNEGNTKCMHGTYMVSIISGTDTKDGYVGIAPNADVYFYGYDDIKNLTPLKLLAILQEMKDVDVINMSFATDEPIFFPRNRDAKQLNDYIQTQVLEKNQIIVASCGNNGIQTGFAYYPAAYDQMISISAFMTNEQSKIELDANFWEGVSIAGVWDAFFDLADNAKSDFAGLQSLSGTSPTAAFISGIFCLLKSNTNKRNTTLNSNYLIEKFCPSVSLFSERANKTYTTHILEKLKVLSIIKN